MNLKNKNKYKIILIASFVLFSFFFSSKIIFAKTTTPENGGGLSNTGSSNTYKLLAPLGKFTEVKTDNIGEYFNKFFKIAIGLAGVLAVIMIVVGGVQWMGSESIFGKTEGKKRVTQAILGLLIALGSYALLNTINPDLLGTKGLQINQASNNGEAGTSLKTIDKNKN